MEQSPISELFHSNNLHHSHSADWILKINKLINPCPHMVLWKKNKQTNKQDIAQLTVT